MLTVKQDKPALVEGLNGGWLVAVVAAQSVCVLGAPARWLEGGMLYWLISLIFYRYTFFPLSPAHLAPPYWVNMGAVAISTLAGTTLIAAWRRSWSRGCGSGPDVASGERPSH